MSSSIPKLSLPDIYTLTISKSAQIPKKQSFTDRLYKTKPTYLAKKVMNEEMEDSCKPIGTVALSQINEEKMNEAEDLMEVESINQTREVGEPYNIFKKEGLNSSKYKEHQKGPVYMNGQLVKHSIVGPQEVFERQQRGIRRNLMKESAVSSEKDSFSFSERSPSRMFKPLNSMATMVEQSPSASKFLESQSSFAIRKITSVIKKKESKEVKVTKESLYKKLEELRNSQADFYEIQKQKYQNLPLGDKLHATKEQRCLTKYEETTDYWDKLHYNITRRIKRGAGKSVMLRSDDFRQKIEEAEAFELAKTEGEKYGTACWTMSLRNANLKDPRDSQQDLKSVGGLDLTRTSSRVPSSLEIIRKSTRISKSTTSLPTLKETIYLDRTKRDYISGKNPEVQKALRKFDMKSSVNVEDFLVICYFSRFSNFFKKVEGTNKLESEIQSLFKKIPYERDGYVIPKDLFDSKLSLFTILV